MAREVQSVDVLVVGGGPAGSTAAGLLASWGRSVVMVHRDSSQPDLVESLPASTRKIFQFLGQIGAVEAARFHPNHGNLSRWAGKAAQATSDEAGYHVARRALDRRLREHARSQGARIVEAQVQRVEFSEPLAISVAGERGGLETYSSTFVLDCSGRAGVVARKGLRRSDAGYRTLAVVAEWECDDWPDHERAHTIVDSYQDGWAWSVPLSATRRQCTVMIDRERTAISKASLDEVYRREIGKAIAIHQRLGRARQTRHVWACDASLYDATRAVEGRALLVGDAASFIEPLSSAGVKKALTSAWRAAVVVNTCLDKPGMLGLAADFYDQRERHVYRECLRRSAAFFQAAATEYGDEFWKTRADSSRRLESGSGSETSDRDLSSDRSIVPAFERLRRSSSLRLTLSTDVTFGKTADIEGREIVIRDAVVIPGVKTPVRFAAGVNLPTLMQLSTRSHNMASLIGAYESEVGKVDPESLLRALSMLVAKNLLVLEKPR